MENSNKLVKIVYDALDGKKAEDIRILDIRNVSVIADYFIIANGSNTNHLQALIDNVEEEMAKEGYYTRQTEGKNTNWVLLDYNDIIVHVFSKEDRLFYDLERIWSDGKEININELV